MKPQCLRILRQSETPMGEVAIDFVACRNGQGFVPKPPRELLHPVCGKVVRLPAYRLYITDTLLDMPQNRSEPQAQYSLEQLDSAAGPAAPAIVITFAILVG